MFRFTVCLCLMFYGLSCQCQAMVVETIVGAALSSYGSSIGNRIADKAIEVIVKGGETATRRLADIGQSDVFVRKSKMVNSELPSNVDMSNYDFIIDIPDVPSIQTGWPVYVSYESRNIIQGRTNHNQAIIALLGYYSKGKSFFCNQLRLAGMGKLQRDEGTFFFPARTDASHMDGVPVGPGVTTRGISGMYTGFKVGSGQEVEDSSTLLLDTAGRNAPAEGTPHDMAGMAMSISDLRSKERLIDDIIINVADTVFYVVDEVLNEDQRTIHYIVENAATSGQEVGVVHNFKRLNSNDPKAENHIHEQIIKAFDAKQVELNEGAANIYGGPLRMWESKWIVKTPGKNSKPVKVLHFALFNHETSWIQNNPVFNYINIHHGSAKRGDGLTEKSPVLRISQVANKHLPNYVREIDVPAAEECNSDKKSTESDEWDFLSESQASSAYLFITRNVPMGKQLQLLHWNIREMPLGFSTGEFSPNHHHYVDDVDGLDKIRIDLPGLTREDGVKYAETNQMPSNRSFFFFTRKEYSDSEKLYIIGGRRLPVLGDTSLNTYGTFHVEIKVLYKYASTKPEIIMENGVMWIISRAASADSDEDFL